MPRLLPIAGLALLAVAPPPTLLGQDVPTPLEHFGHEIGAEGFLADWNELGAYYEAVAVASPRVAIDTLGATTLGEPFLRLVITSEENHNRLDRYLEIQTKLADPRRLVDDAELEALLDEGRTVVLLTSHIHSTEVAAGQMPARLLYRLATATDLGTLEILDETILVMIPSLNPDGTQLVSEWWREWRGTEFEGAPLPRLYHHYIGHNNNRDWFFFAQRETLLTVLHAHNEWRPQIVHDVHQMGSGAARYFVPPYIDPVEPNVDPRLIAGLNQLGKYMAAEMTKDGFDGVVTDAIFDIYTPARAYMHYHGGVRILSETASANGPLPIVQEFEELGGTADYHAQEISSNFPSPWRGGRWGLDDGVDYMEAGAMALLRNAAINRRFWLENFVEIHRAALEGWEEWPEAWVIPSGQANTLGLDHLLRVLTTGDVEVHRAEEAFTVEGRTFPEGSYVVPMGQPYAAFAQTLLESQDYLDLRQYPGGPPIRPYDATAHTLPLLFGVEAVAVESMAASDGAIRLSPPIAQRTEHTFAVPEFLQGPDAPRIGLYRAYQEPMPQGWTRWLFDEAGIAYEEVRNEDVRAGRLAERFDVLVFQDQSASSILTGHSPERMPPPYAGGVEREGVEALRTFVEEGGRLVAVDAATEFAIDVLELDVRNAVDGLSDTEFYIPGSILALELDPDHPMAEGVPSSTMAWYWRTSRAFQVDDPRAEVVGRFGDGDPRLAGWVLGEEHLAGLPALVEARVGEGSVVLFGFQPNFRGQTVASWPLFLNSLR